MKRIHTSILFIFGALVWQACSPAESAHAITETNEPIPVRVINLQKQEVLQPITVSGKFSTDDETTLSFKTGGIVQDIFVKEGNYVRKGKLLATLDLTEVKTGMSQAELAFQKAQRDFSRTTNLYLDSVATLEQFQNAQTALFLAEQQLKSAKFNLTYSEIRATADGYVLKKYVNAGQVVDPGTPIVRMNGAGNSPWIFKTSVSDKDWAILEEGDSATILTDAIPEQPMPAQVVRKSEGADPVNGAFNIELRLENNQQNIMASGLFGTATIFPQKTVNVWLIPYESLLDGNADEGYVFVTSDKKTAQKVSVTIASMDNDYVYISGGLENATSLITLGSAYLQDESRISITE